MQLTPIGIIHSPYKQRGEAPRQGRLTKTEVTLEIFPPFNNALKDISRCSHLIVLYWCHQADREMLLSRPPLSPVEVGVFASRSPHRPNPIAFCVADLVRDEENRLIVTGVDALDGSPLLDIKAYIPAFDSHPQAVTSHLPDRLEGFTNKEISHA